jgi:hypothetical protein
VFSRRPKEEDREERMMMEIVVDAYGFEEQALGWYYYLEDTLTFPFVARCRSRRPISPLRDGDEIDVVGMAPEDQCMREMFVMIRWERDGLGVPLSQLAVVHAEEETRQAVEDWHYWVERHYQS